MIIREHVCAANLLCQTALGLNTPPCSTRVTFHARSRIVALVWCCRSEEGRGYKTGTAILLAHGGLAPAEQQGVAAWRVRNINTPWEDLLSCKRSLLGGRKKAWKIWPECIEKSQNSESKVERTHNTLLLNLLSDCNLVIFFFVCLINDFFSVPNVGTTELYRCNRIQTLTYSILIPGEDLQPRKNPVCLSDPREIKRSAFSLQREWIWSETRLQLEPCCGISWEESLFSWEPELPFKGALSLNIQNILCFPACELFNPVYLAQLYFLLPLLIVGTPVLPLAPAFSKECLKIP